MTDDPQGPSAHEWLEPVQRLIGAARPCVVGIAGSVAVGKSTAAGALAEALAARPGARVEVVATDSFLMPNAQLDARGLTMRKGFPESYDLAALGGFLRAVRAGASATIPVYSHRVYDIEGTREVAADTVVLEGVNALDPQVVPLLDVAVYLHADEALVEEWYTARFLELCGEAEGDPGSFYAWAVALDEAARRTAARYMWEQVNLVNLREHIGPTRAAAHVVVEKGRGHTVERVVVRRAGSPGPGGL